VRALPIVVLTGAALLCAAPAQAATPKKTIRIGDNYYLPDAARS
jgi:hypothetical protein